MPFTSSRSASPESSYGNVTDRDLSYPSSDVQVVKVDNPVVPDAKNRFIKALRYAAADYRSLAKQRQDRRPPSVSLERLKRAQEYVEDWGEESTASTREIDIPKERDPTVASERSDSQNLMKLLCQPHPKRLPYATLCIENVETLLELPSGANCTASIKRGTLGGKQITYVSKSWYLSHNWEGFFSELALYTSPAYLRDLQGDVLPAIIGVYVVDCAINIAMELPDNSFWVEATNDMPDGLKEKCVLAFDKIHSRGVLHNDVALRHMLIGSKGNVVIIDFQKSQVLSGDDVFGLEDCCQADIRLEKRKVKFQLNYQGAVAKENIWRNHYSELDPDTRRHSKEYSLDPIIDGPEWRTEWLDNGFESSCFVLPGQDEKEVQSSLKRLSAREYYQWKIIPSSGPVPPPSLSTTDRPSILASKLPKRKRSDAQTNIDSSPAKRQRQETKDAPPSFPDSRTYQPPQKINRYYEDLKHEIMSSSAASSSRLPARASEDDAVVLAPSKSCTDSSQPSMDVATVPLMKRNSTVSTDLLEPAEAHCCGSDLSFEKSAPPGVYTGEQLVMLRRLWILQETLIKCKDEGLVYPLAAKLALTPSTDPSGDSRKQPDGKALDVCIGKMKRVRRRDEQDPYAVLGEIHSRKHQYRTAPYPVRKRIMRDFDKTLPDTTSRSGPEILSPTQFKERFPKAKRPLRGILRRRLTEKEKREQQEYEASLAEPIDVDFYMDDSTSDSDISDAEFTTTDGDGTATERSISPLPFGASKAQLLDILPPPPSYPYKEVVKVLQRLPYDQSPILLQRMVTSGALSQRISFFHEGMLQELKEHSVQDTDSTSRSDPETPVSSSSSVSVDGEFLSSEDRKSAVDHLGQIGNAMPTLGSSDDSNPSLMQTAQNLFSAFRRRFLDRPKTNP